MKIAIAGTGYVGLSMAVLLSQNNDVVAVDILKSKVDLINEKKSPIVDKEIEEFLSKKSLNLSATTDWEQAYKKAEIVVISTPTNYDEEKNLCSRYGGVVVFIVGCVRWWRCVNGRNW